MTRFCLALALALLVQGCGGGGRDVASPFDRRQDATQIQLNVDNQSFNDVRLYVESVRGRQTVGTVSGNSRKTFRIDWGGLDELSVRMEFLASENYVSNIVNAAPGDRVELFIPDNPRNAILRRRR